MLAKYSPVTQKDLVDSVYDDCANYLQEYADEDVKTFRESLKGSINERLRTVKKTYDKQTRGDSSNSNSNTPAQKKHKSISSSPPSRSQPIREENQDELSRVVAKSSSKDSRDDEIQALQEALRKAEEKIANESKKTKNNNEDGDDASEDDEEEDIKPVRPIRSVAAAAKRKTNKRA